MAHLTPDFKPIIRSGLRGHVADQNLCAACKKLRSWTSELRMRHYDDLNHLRESASREFRPWFSRCWMCETIYDEFFKYMGDRSHPRSGQWDAHVENPHPLLLWFAQRAETGDGFLDHLRGYEKGPRILFQDVSSKAAFNLMRAWAWRCDNQHRCWQGKKASLPTRVLDVSRDTPYLLITNNQHSRYITLSHCWGGEQPLVTTVASLRERTTGTPMESFPPLYLDAIRTTRELGIKYLWIDSLCILQDCKDDWAREAAKMADVYRQSYLTLYALSSSNCHQKMLVQREAVDSDDLESPNSQIHGKQRQHENFRKAPLFQRAWAVQERLLSPRVLYFGKEELFWECLKCTAREGSWQIETHKHNIHRYEAYLCGQEKVKLSPYSRSSDWQMIVSEYTRGRLTYPSDKLPAISGLASLYKTYTNYTYLAGLWRQNLMEGMLWFCPPSQEHENVVADPSEFYRGPSWSWISTDLAVQFKTFWEGKEFSQSGAPDIEFVDYQVKLRGVEKLGEIQSATLIVRASFFRIHYERRADSRRCVIYDSDKKAFGKGVLDADDAVSLVQQPCAAILLAQRGREKFKWENEGDEFENFNHLRPSPGVIPQGEHEMSTAYFMLVVRSPSGGKEERWRRIGLAWTSEFIEPAPELSIIQLI